MSNPVLLLNASYEPLNVIHWQKAVRLLYLEKVDVLEEYMTVIRSPNIVIYTPAVVKLTKYIRRKHRGIVYSKWNMYVRDRFDCQYCGKKIKDKIELTRDHVIPRSYGGGTSWKNCVTCCKKCNLKKGGRTPKQAAMKLIQKPRTPKDSRITFNMRKRGNGIPEQWMQYIGNPGK